MRTMQPVAKFAVETEAHRAQRRRPLAQRTIKPFVRFNQPIGAFLAQNQINRLRPVLLVVLLPPDKSSLLGLGQIGLAAGVG
jgi:hypothetical protein